MASDRKWTIYLLTNTVNGKRYVGQTITSLKTRINRHKATAKSNPGCMAISAAIAKYGWEAFDVDVLSVGHGDRKRDEKEAYWIAKLQTHVSQGGYNLEWASTTLGGHSDETRKRMSDVAKANPHNQNMMEYCSTKGMTHSTETRTNMSMAKKKLYGKTVRLNYKNTGTGRKLGPMSPEHKAKLRAAALKRKRDEHGLLLPGKVTRP